MKLFLANLPTIILALVAGYLAVNNIYGWGWFLLAALLVAHVVNEE